MAAFEAQPPPEENSDADVQEFLELQLNKEAPGLTQDLHTEIIFKFSSVYREVVECLLDMKVKYKLEDHTFATALAVTLRVFCSKKIEMTTTGQIEKVFVVALLLACANHEERHTMGLVEDMLLYHKYVTKDDVREGKTSVLQVIDFQFRPTSFHFLEAACRQCTPPEVTAAQAAELFCALVRKLMLLTSFYPLFMLRLPSEVCFGCALAARKMLDITCDVTLTPAERLEYAHKVCNDVTYFAQISDSLLASKSESISALKQQIQDNVSEIRTLLQTVPAAGAGPASLN